MSSFNRPPTQEELNAPTDFEIAQITEGLPDVERERFTAAAVCLYFVKCRLGNRTPWRQLVRLQRLDDELVPVEIEMVYADGRQEIETVYLDRSDPQLKGSDALMSAAVRDLSDALRKIESFEPDQYVSHVVENHVFLKRQKVVGALGGRPASEDATPEKIGTWLKKRGYVESLNKKELVSDAMAHFKVGKTKVTDAITGEGLARKKMGRSTRK